MVDQTLEAAETRTQQISFQEYLAGRVEVYVAKPPQSKALIALAGA